jgi:hypothetical protein
VGIWEQLTPYKKYGRQEGGREKRRRGVKEKARFIRDERPKRR